MDIDAAVRHRLTSNLKHLMVGLELKTALVIPHRFRPPNGRPMLFEPYYQNLIQEFCVGAFSVIEGLGAAQWLSQNGHDGSDGRGVSRNQWRASLRAVYDDVGEHGLDESVERTLSVRDKLHQDQIGARANIDWHAFSYEAAFVPASHAIRTILRREAHAVPATSNLHVEPQ
ncbi:hypothetical protein [Sphingopyxis sp. MG]|uniref:hypothetical protein n=1 Tax=Sphingopyxis sp. MG TaxID=1866325 RepID=UPI000CDF2F8C|nr:hypothetical protein [Sphingopyxis sp. MG]AVA13491.1 hypothetical protein C3E99_06195 [Sphingopyxis sp. MG]